MSRHDRRAWAAARSLSDLGETTARWLAGELEQTPGHLGPPDEETTAIRDDLIALNRAGFVTTCSQPGVDPEVGWDGQIWAQRAFVEAYTTAETAAAVRRACAAAGLACIVQPVSAFLPWWRSDWWATRHAVTLRGESVNTSVPGTWRRSYFAMTWGRWISADADAALRAAHLVVVVDEHWGARSALWDTLRAVVAPRLAARTGSHYGWIGPIICSILWGAWKRGLRR